MITTKILVMKITIDRLETGSLSKTEYYTTLLEINQGNSKKLWSYLRELVPKCVKHVSSSLIDGVKKLTDPQEIADKFNDFFTSIVLKYIPEHQNEQISNNDHLLLSIFIQTKIAPSTKFSIPLYKKKEFMNYLLILMNIKQQFLMEYQLNSSD